MRLQQQHAAQMLQQINYFGFHFIQILGPVTVDVTPPEFEGKIIVNTKSSEVNVCWIKDAFFDDIDTDLHFEIGIGEGIFFHC